MRASALLTRDDGEAMPRPAAPRGGGCTHRCVCMRGAPPHLRRRKHALPSQLCHPKRLRRTRSHTPAPRVQRMWRCTRSTSAHPHPTRRRRMHARRYTLADTQRHVLCFQLYAGTQLIWNGPLPHPPVCIRQRGGALNVDPPVLHLGVPASPRCTGTVYHYTTARWVGRLVVPPDPPGRGGGGRRSALNAPLRPRDLGVGGAG